MKTVTAVALGAVVVSGSMLAASRASVPPDFSSLPAAAQSATAAVVPTPRKTTWAVVTSPTDTPVPKMMPLASTMTTTPMFSRV